MGKEQKSFLVYKDVQQVVNELTDEQAGQLFKGMIGYSTTGKAPKFDGILKFVFIPIKQQMDRDAEKYSEKCEKNRENVKLRWERAKNTNAYERIRSDTNYTDTDTDTDIDTDTKTDIDTETTTDTDAALRQQGGSRSDDDDSFNIWKRMTPQDVDSIYEVYPESGGFLIDEVYAEVKTKKKKVKDPVAYILGYAKNVGWEDTADHFDY